MTEKTLQILDNSVRYSLWAFLIILAAILIYVLAARRKTRGVNPAKAGLHAAFFAAILASVFFLVICFTPLSFLDNFASVKDLEEAPLRLTALIYERSYEGFSLQGELWNQSDRVLEGVQAEVRIWGNDQALLDRVTVPIEPSTLSPDQSAAFSLTYNEKSPFLYGYEVAFLSPDGEVIPHVKGFDVD